MQRNCVYLMLLKKLKKKSLFGKTFLKEVVLWCFNESSSTHKTTIITQTRFNFCRNPFLQKKNPKVTQTAPKTSFTGHFLLG